jgi:RES domain-containing protein
MEAWRISNFHDLSGLGGLKASGRWHTRGKPIVYLADHPASALLELLVRIDTDLIPDSYTLLHVRIPESVAVAVASGLPPDWRDRTATTRQIGDDWIERSEAAVLRAPSAIVPKAHNFLLNPAHPGASDIRIIDVISSSLDERLFRLPEWKIPERTKPGTET